jgi:hypothetical protein
VARHIFQACPVWIYTQSNITQAEKKSWGDRTRFEDMTSAIWRLALLRVTGTISMGLMQVSVQFPGISVIILEVLYVVYIIITSVHQQFGINRINSS